MPNEAAQGLLRAEKEKSWVYEAIPTSHSIELQTISERVAHLPRTLVMKYVNELIHEGKVKFTPGTGKTFYRRSN